MFTNTLTLCRFVFRRDRVRMIVWAVGLILLIVGYGATFPDSYPEQVDIDVMAASMENPMMVAMIGPIYTDDDGTYTKGSLYAVLMFVWSGIAMGIMNIMHVVRHTRQDEEHGRIEVIRSLPVGRLANLSAALLSAFILNIGIGIVFGLGLGAIGIEGMDMSGSMLFGLALGALGMLFAAITAVFCQMFVSPGTAQGWSWGVLIAAFIVRAAGDMQGNDTIASISPFGLLHRSAFFTGNETWPLITGIIITVVALAIAFRLCATRDMGEGLIAAKPGRADAKPSLKSAGALALRLTKNSIIIWVVMVFLIAAAYGSVMGDLDSFIDSNDMFNLMSGGSTDTRGDPMVLVSALIVILMTMGCMPVIQFMLKARSQESRGYAEGILACSVSRTNQLSGYFIIALVTCIVVPVLSALGVWLSSSSVMEEPIAFGDFMTACMVYLPAILFTLGVAVMLIGYLPRFASYTWLYLGYGFCALYFGNLFGAPEWVGYLSPFAHTPVLPRVEVLGVSTPVYELSGGDITSLIVMTVLAVLMMVLGFIGYRKRDMVF